MSARQHISQSSDIVESMVSNNNIWQCNHRRIDLLMIKLRRQLKKMGKISLRFNKIKIDRKKGEQIVSLLL